MNAYTETILSFVTDKTGVTILEEEIPAYLIRAFEPVIQQFAQDYARQDMDLEDSIQNGYQAVLEKWQAWDMTKGESFEAYMVNQIRNYCDRTYRRDYDHGETNFSDHGAELSDERYDDTFPERQQVSLSDRADADLLVKALEALDQLSDGQKGALKAAKVF